MVCTRSLSSFANKINLGDYLYLGKGEEINGRTNVKILENAFEALLAAIYLDSGSKEIVAKFLIPIVDSEIQTSGSDVNYDYSCGNGYSTLLDELALNIQIPNVMKIIIMEMKKIKIKRKKIK